jgi:hypothetical protein
VSGDRDCREHGVFVHEPGPRLSPAPGAFIAPARGAGSSEPSGRSKLTHSKKVLVGPGVERDYLKAERLE